jgi:hypothetical protein
MSSSPPPPRSAPLPGPGASPQPPAPAPLPPDSGASRPSLARRLWPVLAVVVAAVVVLSYFALAGFGTGGSNGGSTGTTFGPAASAANRTLVNVPGGPWSLVTALGFAPASSSELSPSSSVGTGCNVSGPGGGIPPLSVEIPAFSGSFSSGAAPWWGMFYYQSASHEVLLVDVVQGVATPLVVASGSCVSTFSSLSPVPSGAIDSSTAAATAWANGGSGFVSFHSNLSLNLEMAIVGGGDYQGTHLGPSWLIEYSPCLPLGQGGPPGNQSAFEALLDALTGSATTLDTTTTC